MYVIVLGMLPMSEQTTSTYWLVYYASKGRDTPIVIGVTTSKDEAERIVNDTQKFEAEQGWGHDKICYVPIRSGLNLVTEDGDGPIPLM